MPEQQDSTQGPADPTGPGGIDAPTPPGGPQRTDAPDAPVVPGEPAQDTGPGVARVTKREDGEAPSPTPPDPGQDTDAAQLQQENAETSLDQPSQ